jgi:hypothetical protein
VLTKQEIDRRMEAAARLTQDRPITPQHAQAEGELDALTRKPRPEKYPPVSEDKPRDLEHVEDREDPDVEKGGKWKKIVQDLLAAVAQPVGQQSQDGTSEREAHDPVVPYQDMPEDDAASMPMLSTAPVCDPDTGKVYDFLGTMRQVTGPQDIGPGGLFTGKRLPPDSAPENIPGPVSPEQFRKGPVREGHAAAAPVFQRRPYAPNQASIPATPGGAGKLGRADTGQAVTTRLPGSS